MVNRLNKIKSLLGSIILGLGVIFFLVFSFVKVGNGDIIGLVVPTPPLWTSYIPYLGWVLNLVYEFFSLHGIVELVITGILVSVGLNLNREKCRKISDL